MTIDSHLAPNIFISIQDQDFCVKEENQRLKKLSSTASEIGAIVTFVGNVREISNQQKLNALSLEHYPGMTEKQLHNIAQQALVRWDLLSVSVIHRIGKMIPSEQIVFVGVSCTHRKAAFEACEYIMDILKTNATFWKKEHFDDHEKWVEAKQSDTQQADSWQ